MNGTLPWSGFWFQGRWGGMMGAELQIGGPASNSRGRLQRTTGIYEGLFAHNTFVGRREGDRIELVQQFRTESASTGRPNQYIVVRDQYFFDEGEECATTIKTCDHHNCNTFDNAEAGILTDMLVEENLVVMGPGKASSGDPVGFCGGSGQMNNLFETQGGDRMTVRNNIWDLRNANYARYFDRVVARGAAGETQGSQQSPNPNDIHAYGNTVITAGTVPSNRRIAMVECQPGSSGCRARNNLLYEMNASSSSGVIGNVGSGSNNAFLTNADGCPFAGTNGACSLSSAGSLNRFSYDATELQVRASGGSRSQVVGQGFSFPDTSVGGRRPALHCDAFGTRRASGATTIGAHAAVGDGICLAGLGGGGGGGGGGTPPAAPILLP